MSPILRPLHRLAACLLLPLLLVAGASHAGDAPIHQLRVYEIFDDTREAFHDRFRDHAMRIMDRHGFQIVAIWESRADDGRLQFVYLLQWPDEDTMRARWAAFMADAEWAEIKRRTAREHGRFVGDIEERTLVPTGYSPHPAFPVE
jgi:heme-degrading monooxygenase HmoA